jgi:hypothetical protein
MIGLDFVKKIDKNWDKNIRIIYVQNYDEKRCKTCGKIIY